MITAAKALRTSRDSPPTGLSDEALLLGYADTLEAELFEELVKRYAGELYDYLKRYSGDGELADDALQGTWLQLHLKCDTFQEGRTLRPWLYTIAVHQVIDAMRSQRRHRMLSIDQDRGAQATERARLSDCLPSSLEFSADTVERQEAAMRIRQAVTRLPAHQRELVRLIFFDGFKYHEAAAELAIPEGTAKSRMHAAFKQLQPDLRSLTPKSTPQRHRRK